MDRALPPEILGQKTNPGPQLFRINRLGKILICAGPDCRRIFCRLGGTGKQDYVGSRCQLRTINPGA